MHYPRQGGGPRVDMLMLRCLMGQPYVTRLLPLHRSQSTPWSMRDSFHIFFCSLNFATQSTWSGISISWILWRSSAETLEGLVNSGKGYTANETHCQLYSAELTPTKKLSSSSLLLSYQHWGISLDIDSVYSQRGRRRVIAVVPWWAIYVTYCYFVSEVFMWYIYY